MKSGDPIPELRVFPDRTLPHRYAGASEDFNQIHIDPKYAQEVAGLPGNVLHGLYMMSLAARASAEAAGGDPRALKKLSVEFSDTAFPEKELVVEGAVREVEGDHAVVDCAVKQDGNEVVSGGEAELDLSQTS